MPIKIYYLADIPESILTIAGWFKEYWGGFYPERSIEAWADLAYANKDKVPFTLVAVDETEAMRRPIGTATIKFNGMGDFEPEACWLSSVYVIPTERGKGIATSLILSTLQICRELGVGNVSLFTRTDGRLYTKLGWSQIAKMNYQATSVKLMKNDLGKAATPAVSVVWKGKPEGAIVGASKDA